MHFFALSLHEKFSLLCSKTAFPLSFECTPGVWLIDRFVCLFAIPPLPRNRFANLYFLFIVLLNWVPAINAFGKEISMLPVILGKRETHQLHLKNKKITSVADPLHVGVDPDPDPRINASD